MSRRSSRSSRSRTTTPTRRQPRFDLSHLSPEEGQATLQALVRDLCFWGDLTVAARPTSSSRGASPVVVASKASLHRQHSTSSRSSSSTSSRRSSSQRQRQEGTWKTATDALTGQTYYYDTLTRVTQWEKPAEIRAWEKQQRKEQRQRDRSFFAAMEETMRQHRAAGRVTRQHSARALADFVGGPPQEPLGLQVPSKQQRIRTISAMDEHMLAQVDVDTFTPIAATTTTPRIPPLHSSSHNNTNNNLSLAHIAEAHPDSDTPSFPAPGRPPLPQRRPSTSDAVSDTSPAASRGSPTSSTEQWDSMELSPDHPHVGMGSPELQGMRLLEDPAAGAAEEEKQAGSPPPATTLVPRNHIRRNTGENFYVGSTMTSPDIAGTIRCVCGVYRAHILQSAQSTTLPVSAIPVGATIVNPEVFRDDVAPGYAPHVWDIHQSGASPATQRIPTLEDIEFFYKEFFRRSQMEHDTIIMSLIYVERLIKQTDGALSPTLGNWRSLLFSCMVLASKVWDDLSMWNIDFSNVSVASGMSSFTVQRINQLEVALLSSLRFDVRVPASEYAKYYFLIRTMQFRSGQTMTDGESKQNHTTTVPVMVRRAKSVDWGSPPDPGANFGNTADPLFQDVRLPQMMAAQGALVQVLRR